MTSTYKLDMTTMLAYHDALRRDLGPVALMTGRSEGWDLFKRFLHVHHVAEDEALWPVMRQALIRTDDVVLLDEPEQRLDRRRRRILAEVLVAKKSDGTAILMASHDQDLVAHVANQRIQLA